MDGITTHNHPQVHESNLAEELFAIQAIYTFDVVRVASSTSSHTSIEVHWPGNGFALQLRLLPTYAETSLIFFSIDLLSMTIDEEKKQLIDAFEKSLQDTFRPGHACLFELL